MKLQIVFFKIINS